MKDELLYRDECFRIVGACLAVHRDKGSGFIEAVYQDAMGAHYPYPPLIVTLSGILRGLPAE